MAQTLPIQKSDEIFVHPTAIVDPAAKLGPGSKIGPYAIVGPNVELGAGCVLHPHAIVDGHTTLGAGVEIFPFAAVGLRPQDLKFDGTPTRLVVGDRTVIRESATLQPGSVGAGDRTTRVGSDCLIMAYCHIAHDCVIGDRVVMANAAQIAGHCVIEDHAIIGGVTTIHQFVRVGTRAITGASTRLQLDVPPYCLADGHPAALHGLNVVGLKRAGMSEETRRALKRAYKALFRDGRYKLALDELEASLAGQSPEVGVLVSFLRGSSRGVTRAAKKGSAGGDEASED